MENSRQHRHKIVISGGGTGGHIFPAIAIANALKNKCNADILFVGAKGRMEMEKVPAAGYPIEGLWISGLQRKITLKNLLFPFKVLASITKARQILKKFNPEVVVGVGGYASGPTLKAAVRLKIPTLIQEQNSFPGITNKLLAKSVRKICVAYEGMEKFFPAEKIVITGNPIRHEVIKIEGKKKEAAAFFGLDQNKNTVLIVGGSQGALAINKAIHKQLEQFVRDDIQLIWQTGKYYYPQALEAVEKIKSKQIKAVAFIDRMEMAYAMADLIISRAGAIAISEICAVAKPPIFIPLPTAAEDHQTKNAQALVEKNAAMMITNQAAATELYPAISELISNNEKQTELRNNLRKLARTNAADQIADEILALIKK
ncbi:MAG: undecaprenyldiphospho-muramoylpentapeptide beta-N-acetylglucosaminyltransferase [Bacteroidetes bacterium]|nr:undecaprenyldiphospho-muramoylpentapeptide beta-N-acetylglucosaminyltransferase [Bacteroidota bacterium]